MIDSGPSLPFPFSFGNQLVFALTSAGKRPSEISEEG